MDPGWVSGHQPENRVWAKARATGGHSAGGPERAASVENAWNRKYSNWVLWGGDELRKHRRGGGGLPPTRHRTGTPPGGRGQRTPRAEWEPGAPASSPAARDPSAFPPGVGGGGRPVGHARVGCSGDRDPAGLEAPGLASVPSLTVSPDAVHSYGRHPELCPRRTAHAAVTRELRGLLAAGGVPVLQRRPHSPAGVGAGARAGARPRWALTTLSPRPRRTMLREQYVDRARVAVFGKVSRAAVSGGPVQARGRGPAARVPRGGGRARWPLPVTSLQWLCCTGPSPL